MPLVIDAFGDSDTREAAEDYLQMPDAVRLGFNAKPLFAALDTLADRAPSPPIGIVLGSGFEDRPKLIDSLDKRYRLLGTKAETVAEVKDPARFFPLLKQTGIAHPETSLTPPGDPHGWLAKRRGAAGGAHIRDLARLSDRADGYYFQRRIDGTAMSVLAVTSAGGVAMELSRQWTAPSVRRPYRYGGAVIIDYDESLAHDPMISAAATLVELLDPVGLVSFDFIVADGVPYLLEINPRPGATLDIFDDLKGNLFRAHVEAGLGNALWQSRELPNVQSRAAAVLYAGREPLIARDIAWPEWASDRPMTGTAIQPEQPLATVRADGNSAAAAEALVRERLSTLADLVYRSFEKA